MKRFFLIIPAFVLIHSCKKDRSTRLSGRMLEIIAVDTGSYFVFRDSVSSQLDTFRVVENKLEIEYCNTNSQHEDAYTQEHAYYIATTKKHPQDTLYQALRFDVFSTSNIMNASFHEQLYYSTGFRVYSEPFILNENASSQQTLYDDYSVANIEEMNIAGNNYNGIFENIFTRKDLVFIIHSYYSVFSGLAKYSIRTDTSYTVKELIYAHIKRKLY